MKETHDKIKKGKLEFQVIYSRKIQGAVILFTVFMFACQYGLTRETVAENFSRTGICWSEFALNVVFSILLIFLVWDDDYILSEYDFVVDQLIENSKIFKSADIKSISEGNQSISYKDNSGAWTITDDIKAMLPKPYIKLFY